jgi:hypothetical protein
LAIAEIGLRVAAKLRGRSIPFYTPTSMAIPGPENERFNAVDEVLKRRVRPIAVVLLALGLFATTDNNDAMGLTMVCLGILGMNSRAFFLKCCLVFADVGDDAPGAQPATA